MNEAKYIGLDVHQATISVAVRDADGNHGCHLTTALLVAS